MTEKQPLWCGAPLISLHTPNVSGIQLRISHTNLVQASGSNNYFKLTFFVQYLATTLVVCNSLLHAL